MKLQSDWIEFAKAAIKHPLTVSTVFPTSKTLAGRLIDAAELSSDSFVAEVGCGTGAITKHLVPRLKEKKNFIGVELSEDMVRFLQENFKGFRFEQGPAEDLPKFIGNGRANAVVSSLPWTMFSNDLQKRTIVGIHEALAPGGLFVTYVCLNAFLYPQAQHFFGLLDGFFSSVEKKPIEWRNIPPAIVFVCRK